MQVCTYHEFEFEKAATAYSAFGRMGKGPGFLGAVDGVVWAKMLGTGSGNGFSVIPNLKRYGFFIIWSDPEKAGRFLDNPQPLAWYFEESASSLSIELQPTKTHGLWEGKNPIDVSPVSGDNSMVAVLTRATIRPSKLLDFWWNVPKVSRFMAGAEGAVYRIGVGEYPLVMQATFSVWTDREALIAAAYSNTVHADVVKKTRERNWYAEEMFTQFEVRSISRKGDRYRNLPEL